MFGLRGAACHQRRHAAQRGSVLRVNGRQIDHRATTVLPVAEACAEAGVERYRGLGGGCLSHETVFGSSSAVQRLGTRATTLARGFLAPFDLRRWMPVPLAGLEPATCCLGDNCRYSALTVPVGSRQLRLGEDSGQCALVGCSRAWWNDRENDQLSKRLRGAHGPARMRVGWPEGQSVACRTMRVGVNCGSVVGLDGQAVRPIVKVPTRTPPCESVVAHRCAELRLCRSLRTVRGEVKELRVFQRHHHCSP
jgi:hypothetical protein